MKNREDLGVGGVFCENRDSTTVYNAHEIYKIVKGNNDLRLSPTE